MKKLILWAILVAGFATYQPAKAQISLNINVGAQPSYYPTSYNYSTYYRKPYVQKTYYVPAPNYVYVNKKHYKNRAYRPVVIQRSKYNRPVKRYYSVNKTHYNQVNKAYEHGKGRGHKRH